MRTMSSSHRLDALGAHRDALGLIGAQLRRRGRPWRSPFTTDGDHLGEEAAEPEMVAGRLHA